MSIERNVMDDHAGHFSKMNILFTVMLVNVSCETLIPCGKNLINEGVVLKYV